MVINEVLEYFEQMNRYQNSKFGIVSKELESLMQDAKTSMKDIFNNIKRKIKK
jgi:esterase/lipase